MIEIDLDGENWLNGCTCHDSSIPCEVHDTPSEYRDEGGES